MTINPQLLPNLPLSWHSDFWHGRRMPGRATQAGGCFLAIFILAGFVWGLAMRNPMKGVLIGTAIGAALAVLTWLIDRAR